MNRPVVAVAFVDGILRHLVHVVEEVLVPLRRDVENRVVVGHRVFDGFLEVEGSGLDRIRHIGARQLHVEHERNLYRRRVADRFREDPDLVVEVRGRADAAVEPGRVVGGGPHHGARLSFGCQPRVDRRPHRIDAKHDQRIEVVVERIAERRREEDRASRSGLMMVVHNRGEPLAIHHLVGVDALRHVHHVEVAVVVVADVLLVEARHAIGRASFLVGVAHVPVRHELHAVGVDQRAQNDGVVQDPQRFRIGLRVQPVDRLDHLLRTEHLGRVQAAVDPHHDLRVPRQRPCLVVSQAIGERQLPVRFLDERQLPLVLRRCDDGGVFRPAFFRLADLGDDHPLGLHIELLQVLLVLFVIDEPVVVADGPAKLIFRRCDFWWRCRSVLRLRHRNREARKEEDDGRAGLQAWLRVKHNNLVYEERTGGS